MNTTEQQIQESQYQFPYHYIPDIRNGYFSQSVVFSWGYEYLSYQEFLLKKLESIQFSSLLDVGCGDGRLIFELGKQYQNIKLIGIDTSQTAINHAKACNPKGNYICGDISNKNLFTDKFDVITLVETLEHIPLESIISFIENLAYHLSDDGVLLVTVPTTVVKLNPKHFQHFSLHSLQAQLQQYFAINQYYHLNKWCITTRLLQKFLSNRLFILNEPHLQNLIYRIYKTFFLIASAKKAKRLCIISRKIKLYP
jgi:2-polyprenyl-3-methyl-5-hydroxy-6-metoxy-1,4-benzoquinol methylase